MVNYPIVSSYEFSDPSGLIALNSNTNAPSVPSAFGEGSVNVFSGLPVVRSVDLLSDGFGYTQAHARSFSGLNNTGSNGNGWVVTNQPYLTVASTTGDTVVALIESGQASLLFTVSGDEEVSGTWRSHQFSGAKLSYDSSAKEWTLVDATGQSLTFDDLPREGSGGSNPGWLTTDPAVGYANQNLFGKLKSVQSPGGKVTAYSYYSSGDPVHLLESIVREDSVLGIYEKFSYSYETVSNSLGGSVTVLQSVSLLRGPNSGSLSPERTVTYQYYTGSDCNSAHGRLGDLKLVTLHHGDAQGPVIQNEYYRYTKQSGYQPEPDVNLVNNPSKTGGTDPTSMRRSKVASWSADYSRYRQVASSDPNEYESSPHEGYGQLVIHAHPSAVSGWSETYAGLVTSSLIPTHNSEYLKDDSGLVELFTYYDATTATETVAGEVDGAIWQTKVKQEEKAGDANTHVLEGGIVIESRQYFERSAGKATVYPLAERSVARDTGGSDLQTTQYAYTWYVNTVQANSIKETLPAVGSNQNGPGATDDEIRYAYSDYGTLSWARDSDGYIDYYGTDLGTGGLGLRTRDYSPTGTFSDPGPSNAIYLDQYSFPGDRDIAWWNPPDNSGLNLTTQNELDGFGRPTRRTDPGGNVTYTIYNDVLRETRIYPGWDAVTGTATGPMTIQREYWPSPGASVGQQDVYYETFTTYAYSLPGGSEGSYVPLGVDLFLPSDIQSLTRSVTNPSGQVVAVLDYFSLEGLFSNPSHLLFSLPETTVLGTASNDSSTGNYHATYYEYGDQGWTQRIEDATGTVTRYGYDARGLVTYDSNGNLTTDDQGHLLVWNAWNQLVRVEYDSTVLVEYQYDALKRRIVEDDGTTERHLYYSNQWQVLEERINGNAVAQNVWSPVYVDAMVLRDRDADANTGNGLEERLYVLHDANFNVTALADTDGEIVERYYYEAYGKATILDSDFGPRPDAQSDYAWQYLHQGGRLDTITGNYHFRNRDLSPDLGRWLNQDPIGFEGSKWNLYEYVNGKPLVLLDPNGESGFWSDYWHYLTNPGEMDRDLQIAQNVSFGVAAGAGSAAVVLVSAPAAASAGAMYLWGAGYSATTSVTVASGGVTAGLGATGIYGGYNMIMSSINAYNDGDWNQLAFNGGMLVGGGFGVPGSRPYLSNSFPGTSTSNAPLLWSVLGTIRYDRGLNYNRQLGPPGLTWLSTAPTPAGGAGVIVLSPGVFIEPQVLEFPLDD